MNISALVLKKRGFSLCYRTIPLLARETLFNQCCKINLSLLSTQRESLNSLSQNRHISILSRVKTKLKASISDSTKVRIAGNLVYEQLVDELDYKSFFQRFELPDTFQSWFIFIQLHMWMVMVRTIPERHGREFRNTLVDSMWNDVEIRMGELDKMKSSLKKKYLKELVAQFQAALVAYDEGLLSDDTVLAAAAWRTIFACKNVDPELLENIVLYIRRQLAYLDSELSENIILNGSISFLPLHTILAESKS